MSNDEFQKLVLSEFRDLKEGQARSEGKIDTLEGKIDVIDKQVADLTEFRTEATMKLDSILENQKTIFEIVGEHEVAIRNIKRKVGLAF